ncbi:LOW QUALITY PROTEIN: sialic acid-binding Ig-like lectin 10 [Alosa sapidissima]|uniref:LOW QUALITY PROTEIN: sialic acid-binding Ig-like lectin 10 n=1 Tax=Alosa sapidissima TaxID=34773 RepID=UPI001C07F8C7|nr:LOW QUALITY PROTEIN: sialic acid-binding Ig-like lectin 10 [Alosa sapidissima]
MLQGCLCTEWSIQMPENITAISGSCIVIPCTFSFPAKYNTEVNASSALWTRATIGGPVVLRSDKSLATGFEGEIVGDFKNRNCTTVFTKLPLRFSEPLLFRVEGPSEMKYTYAKELFISFQRERPPHPVLSLSPSGGVRTGRTLTPTSLYIVLSVSIICVDSEQGVMFVMATLSFTVMPRHHGQNVTCEAIYPRKYGAKSHGVESQTLNILYQGNDEPPEPGPVGTLVTLHCLSEANPPVNTYNWYAGSANGQLILRASGQEQALHLCCKGLYVYQAIALWGQEKSAVVALEVEDGSEGQQCSVVPYVICGVLACLYVLNVVVDVYRYKRLTTLRTREEPQGPYATLSLPNTSPGYEQIKRNIKSMPGSESTSEDYQNGPTQRRQRPA